MIKKAYILAQRDAATKSLATRMQCLAFLATPHRGSDMAVLLNNILSAAGLSSRPYISDLAKNSPSLDIINDDFRHYADNVHLWSFYETLKTNLGMQSVMIVERDSATLGFKHERVQLLNANHRGVCKFDSIRDPNYLTVKNALVTIVEDLLGDLLAMKHEEERSQISNLQTYLEVMDKPEDELTNEQENKVEGSCSWILQRDGFGAWVDALSDDSQIYWISAQPATGKSVLAGHVITYLQNFGLDCCYYFFKHSNKGQQSLSGMLRSLSYQMALLHPAVRQTLVSMQEYSEQYDKNDERAVWRKLFVGGIFKVKIQRPQYWVIDALDECVDSVKIFLLLSKIDSICPIRVFITSRLSPDYERHFSRLGKRIFTDSIPIEETLADIGLFLRENMDSLPVEDKWERDKLIEKLVKKSTGCFLWVRLVLQELQQVYSEEHIVDVIEEVPSEMTPLYERVLENMSRNVREKKLAKTILTWVVCSTRPLRSTELANAIKLDVGINVRSLEKSVEGLCSQLLHIDKNGLVQMVHVTARTFLLERDLQSEFAVSKEFGHEQLALTCLRYLAGEEMRSPRNRTLINARRVERSEFAEYACLSFSEHLASASASSDNLLISLDRFLKSNVLTWIEYVAAQKRNLYHLIRTAKNLQKYLHRRAKYTSPLGDAFRNVDRWATDLVRLTSKFGRNLLRYPSSIYFLITPFCPRDSAIYQQFASLHSGLSVTGIACSTWEDCVSYIDYRDSRAMSLACGENTFATGMKSGRIVLYWQTTCQERLTFEHKEPVKVLRFNNNQQLASAGPNLLRLWDINSRFMLWTHNLSHACLNLLFSPDDEKLMSATRGNRSVAFDLIDGSVVQDKLYIGQSSKRPIRQAPTDAAISPDLSLLALVYRGRPVYLWSLENDNLIGLCGGEDDGTLMPNISPETVIFNSNPAVELMVIAFQDGDMTLYETWSQHPIKTVWGDALSLACSPDGRTLATGNGCGVVQIWDFETLTLLYRINTYDATVKSLAFTSDGSRLIDIRDSKTKIWEPSVLIRKNSEEDYSNSDTIAMPAMTVGSEEEAIEITALLTHPQEPVIFVGKDNGSVNSYSALTGEHQSILFSHRKDVFVRRLAWSEGNVIASADASSTVFVHALRHLGSTKFETVSQLFNHHFEEPIRQLLLSDDGCKLLVSTATSDTLWTKAQDETSFLQIASLNPPTRNIWKWLSSQKRQGTLLLMTDSELCHYSWSTLEEVGNASILQRVHPGDPSEVSEQLQLKSLVTDEKGAYLIAEYAHSLGNRSTERFVVWDTDAISGQEIEDAGTGAGTKPTFLLQSEDIKYFLGVFGSKVVFLDNSLWVCSIDLAQPLDSGKPTVHQHCFVPLEFIGGNNGVMGAVTANGDVVFPKEGEVVVVLDALKWSL